MRNRKYKVLIITLISTLTLTTGCGITITRNHYYSSCSNESIKKSNKNKVQIKDTTVLINERNEYN